MNTSETPFWLSRAEVRDLDRRAVDEFGIPSVVLMENAGRGAAELLMRLNPERQPVNIICGPGNNGGDGFVIARHLDIHHYPVHIWLVLRHGENAASQIRSELSPDAAINFQIATAAGIHIDVLRGPLNEWQRDMVRSDLAIQSGWIVDAIFGTGLRDSPGPPFHDVIAAANLSGHPVLAVDLPSGFECDDGKPMGLTIRAAHTATFVAWKKGFQEPTAKDWTGEVHVIDIGAPKKLVDQFRALRQGA